MELPNIAAYAYQDVHVWSALLTCLRPAPHYLSACRAGENKGRRSQRYRAKGWFPRVFLGHLNTKPPPLPRPNEWVGFYSGERREQWRGFKQSLEQLRDTGVQPRQGEVRVNGD